MDINRNNYEEYFLLYADRELPADVRNDVEMFVQQNPDLEEEFIMLQQSVLIPDATIAFEDKTSLFKAEKFIDGSNYEEKFLLYIDNELSAGEIEAVENFVMTNPRFQPEFTLFQKVIFVPEISIVFPHKARLYKKEADARIIPFGWRSMAAAVLLAIGLWLGISYLQKNNNKPYTAVKETGLKENNSVAVDQRDKPAKAPLVKEKAPPAQKTPVSRLQPSPQDVAVKNAQAAYRLTKPEPGEQKNEETATITEPSEKIEVVQPRDNGLPVLNRTVEPNDKTVATTTVVQNNMNTTPASYIEEADEKSENYIFYNITAEDFRKSKIGNFLKKAKRAIAAKLPLKNGFKLGNVEIARDEQN